MVHGHYGRRVLLQGEEAEEQPGKEAVTRFRVLARHHGASELEVELETGRTHQIRVSLAAIGCPVIGDRVYGFRGPDRRPGVQHLGIQVESRAELAEVYERLRRAERPVIEEGETTCCYALSEKSWIDDPQGVQWETFLTTGESTVYGTDEIQPKTEKVVRDGCCSPSCCSSNPV